MTPPESFRFGCGNSSLEATTSKRLTHALGHSNADSPPLFRASLFVWSGDATPAGVVASVTAHLWQTYGSGYLHGDIRPQVRQPSTVAGLAEGVT